VTGPLGHNYGYIVDSQTSFTPSDWPIVSARNFETIWSEFSRQLADRVNKAKT